METGTNQITQCTIVEVYQVLEFLKTGPALACYTDYQLGIQLDSVAGRLAALVLALSEGDLEAAKRIKVAVYAELAAQS